MVSRFGGRDVLSQDASVRSEPAQWARWLTFWTVLGLAFATQVFLAGRRFGQPSDTWGQAIRDRKSTRLNSSHRCISYAVFCLKKKRTFAKSSDDCRGGDKRCRKRTGGHR